MNNMKSLKKSLKEIAPRNTKVISETVDQKLAQLSVPLANCVHRELNQYLPTMTFDDAKAYCERELERKEKLKAIGVDNIYDAVTVILQGFEKKLEEKTATPSTEKTPAKTISETKEKPSFKGSKKLTETKGIGFIRDPMRTGAKQK